MYTNIMCIYAHRDQDMHVYKQLKYTKTPMVNP